MRVVLSPKSTAPGVDAKAVPVVAIIAAAIIVKIVFFI
jgi:hypothetical protein